MRRVFHHISKLLEIRQKYSAARRIFNSLLGVWKCEEVLVFDDIFRFLYSLVSFCNVLVAFLSVVGEKEEHSNTVNVRTRDNKVHGEKTVDQVLEKFAYLAKERIKDSEEEF